MVALDTDDVDAECKRLEAAGVEFIERAIWFSSFSPFAGEVTATAIGPFHFAVDTPRATP